MLYEGASVGRRRRGTRGRRAAALRESLSAAEAGLLAQHAPQYATYFAEQPSSLINRFLGCYKMTLYAHTFHFAVLSSVFAPALGAKPSVCYDLKEEFKDATRPPPPAPE